MGEYNNTSKTVEFGVDFENQTWHWEEEVLKEEAAFARL
jgi:hypothetical protein